MRFIVLFLMLIASQFDSLSQTLEGKVVDEQTGEGIPFVSIGVVGTNQTTISNDAGEFVLKNISTPFKIRYSHVSYVLREETMETLAKEKLLIKLKAAAISLNQIVIDPRRGERILKSALLLASAHEKELFYGNAFYRQLTTVNQSPSQIYELFYDVAFNTSKIVGWAAKESRFAQENKGIAFAISNQSYLTFSLSGSLLTARKSAKIVTLKTLKDFDISISKRIERDDQDIAVVVCKYVGSKKNQYINSTYYIGVNDKKIYRLENTIFNLPIALSKAVSHSIPPYATTVATFNGTKASIPTLESISTKLYLNLSVNGRTLKPVISSMLSVYKLDDQLKTQKFNELTKNIQDKDIVESIAYKPEFWKENPVVKQTTLEDSFIKMMESKSAFGTMITP